jgi:hypothetical protein
MQMIQTQLERNGRQMITWLPQDRRVKVGSVISFQKQTEKWRMLWVSLPIESGEIKRGWNNNI